MVVTKLEMFHMVPRNEKWGHPFTDCHVHQTHWLPR